MTIYTSTIKGPKGTTRGTSARDIETAREIATLAFLSEHGRHAEMTTEVLLAGGRTISINAGTACGHPELRV